MAAISVDDVQRKEMVAQIGAGNIATISGGRIRSIPSGIELPVSAGYVVRVELDAMDTYIVSRVFVRAGKEFGKGVRDNVYADEVGQAAYYASCYVSYDEDEWVEKR